WKLELIDRVERRVHAAPGPPPGAGLWRGVSAAHDEYRHVCLNGRVLGAETAPVEAGTERGGGHLVVAPLRSREGFTVLVNRCFVSSDEADREPDVLRPSSGKVTLTGLLRLTEPGGGFLRRNDPGADRWYSRDVAAIATSRAVGDAAPYFIDADASG